MLDTFESNNLLRGDAKSLRHKNQGLPFSYMYLPTLLNLAVPNCYQPMTRKLLFLPDYFQGMAVKEELPFIDPEGQTEASLSNSYFTQHGIHIDSTCRKGSRLLFNHIRKENLAGESILETDQGYFSN